MTRSKVKVKVMEVRKLRKWPISKSISSANMQYACNQKTNDEVQDTVGLLVDITLYTCLVVIDSSAVVLKLLQAVK